MEKVILTTGGTGGHIFPALAVAQALREANPQVELLFVGGTYGPEAEMAKRADIPFEGLPSRGILGRGLRAAPALFNDFKAVFKALGIMRSFGPCVVAAFGGYASFAPAVAAIISRVPLLLHEQNAVAGMSNRLLARWAKTICVSLPQTEGIKESCVVTGNPIRKEISRENGDAIRQTRRLLVLGGSQGAHALNTWVINNLASLREANVEILHQTGLKDLEEVRAAFRENGYPEDQAQAFIIDMPGAYAWADLALCRSGASTVAELCAAELPSVLVPFPAAIRDHQTLNARNLEQAGASRLVPEDKLGSALNIVLELLDSPALLSQMSRGAASLARPEAAMAVAGEIKKLCVKR